MSPYVQIFGRTVGSYALCAFAGFFAAVFVATRLAKPLKMAFEDVILAFVPIGAGILVGGHLLYAVTNLQTIIREVAVLTEKGKTGAVTFRDLQTVFSAGFGGAVFYGGLLGALAALALYLKYSHNEHRREFVDVFAVCVPLFHAFGRIGCFLGGCCYGVESRIGFMAHNPLMPEMSGVRRFPIALVESGFNLLLFFCLLCLYKRKKQGGGLLSVYLLIYPVGRFVLEFFRGDEVRGIFFHLSTSQWISLALFAAAVTVWVGKAVKRRRAKPQ